MAAAVEGGMPALVGKFGIPFDLDGGLACRQWAAGDRNVFARISRRWNQYMRR